MSKKSEKELTRAAITEMERLSSYLDTEFGVTANMSAAEVEDGLRGLGLDPDAPVPARIRHLFLGGAREPRAFSAAAGAGHSAAGPGDQSAIKTTHVYVSDESLQGECGDEVRLLILRIRSLSRQQRYAEALELAAEATRLEPDYWRARVTLGTLLVMFGRIDEGEEIFRRVSRDFPDNPKALAAGLHGEAWVRETRCGLDPLAETHGEVTRLYAESLRHDDCRANTRASLLLNRGAYGEGDAEESLLKESVLCEGFFEELRFESAIRCKHAPAERAAKILEFQRGLPAWLTSIVCYAGPARAGVYSY
jgi:tetratricopeptide (TPR) repeat protein